MPLELEDTALSYDEWKASGYYVMKGQKSRHRDILGVPQFTADQVCNFGQYRTHREECASKAQAKGTPWGVVEDFDSFVREAGMRRILVVQLGLQLTTLWSNTSWALLTSTVSLMVS